MTSLLQGSAGAPTFWSCFTYTGDPFSGRYRDELGERYEYDSNVPNSRRVTEGDVLVIRDRHLVYGWGIVTHVDREPGLKPMARCPSCGSARLSPRAKALPKFRCLACGSTFDEPNVVDEAVVNFAAHYSRTWLEFVAPVSVTALRPVFASADKQNAIRLLNPEVASRFIELHIGTPFRVEVDLNSAEWIRHGGFLETKAKMRRFQEQFRGKLIDRFGDVCAVTGRQPLEVLDAAHLYSYAVNPEHRERGGLLLRKDVHRLFDTMLLTIEPESLHSRVAPELLKEYPSVGALDGRPLEVPSAWQPDRDLLAAHSVAAHERWRTLSKDLARRRVPA